MFLKYPTLGEAIRKESMKGAAHNSVSSEKMQQDMANTLSSQAEGAKAEPSSSLIENEAMQTDKGFFYQ